MAKKKKSSKAYVPSLSLRQRKFCELFATNVDFFGNGVQSYIEAYNVKPRNYNSAKTGARRLLTKGYILAYINDIMEEVGFNGAHADKQLGFLMTQNAEMGVKLGAIKEFNALKSRIVKKVELGGKDGKPIPISIVDFAKADDTE